MSRLVSEEEDGDGPAVGALLSLSLSILSYSPSVSIWMFVPFERDEPGPQIYPSSTRPPS